MADNRTGSHRTGSTPSSRYNSGNNSKRPGSYSERYNRPNPYTGYLPPGAAPAERIYHPESVDPVRIQQLEREHEQARLHAYEDRAHMPHSADTASVQGTAQYQRMQASRSQSSRSAQDAARRGKQTRRAQVAQQQAARAASYRAPMTVGSNSHLDKIRQNAIDEAEKLRTQPAETVAEPQTAPQPIPEEVSAPRETPAPKESLTAGLPVAGAAQFAAFSNKPENTATESSVNVAASVAIDAENDEKEEKKTDSVETIPIVIPASAVEVISSDIPPAPEAASESKEDDVTEAADAVEPAEAIEPEQESPAEEAAEAEIEDVEADAPVIIPTDVSQLEEISEETEAEESEPEEEAKETEEPNAEPEEIEESAEEAVPEEDIQEAIEQSEDSNDVSVIAPIETAETESPEEEKISEPEITEENAEPEESAEDTADNSCDEESEIAENEPLEEDDDDVKVYVSPEKNAEESEISDEATEEYYEYEDNDEYEEDIVTTPVAAVPAPPSRRRNFETRISSELADPSAYSPGVAQDETLFIRKKRPEEATAVFAATTPGLAPEFDDDDFFEQWLEEGDDMIIKDKRQRRRVSAIIGGATMVFAIIGFIFVIVWFINGIPGGSKTSGSQTDYAKFILPVVNADPEPFETITSVDNNILVEAAINRLTYGEAAADQTYTALEVENETRLLIPAADVEKSGKVLFGEAFTIDYTSMYAIEDEKIYYYSAADDCFHVITTGGDIEPEIVKISHIGSRTQVLLEVGYISASEEAMEGSDYYKMMEYVLNAKDEGGYYVSAIRAIEED